MVTKYEQRKTAMTRRKAVTKNDSAKTKTDMKKSTNGPSMKNEAASTAMATITANIAATKISIDEIDHNPIIEKERVPEENALVRINIT